MTGTSPNIVLSTLFIFMISSSRTLYNRIYKNVGNWDDYLINTNVEDIAFLDL